MEKTNEIAFFAKADLKPGDYYGFYNSKGKWVTGQNKPNKPTPEQLIQINQTLAEMKWFSKAWFKGIGRDLLIVVGIKGLLKLRS